MHFVDDNLFDRALQKFELHMEVVVGSCLTGGDNNPVRMFDDQGLVMIMQDFDAFVLQGHNSFLDQGL